MAKVLVSLDDRLLERLDRLAGARRMSRSALIAEMAAERLGLDVGPGARPAAREALRRTRALFANTRDPVDSTRVIREMRDSR